MEGGDDDEDDSPDERNVTTVPIQCLTQPVLATKRLTASAENDFLAPTTDTAPPRWRKSETVRTVILLVDGVGGQDCSTVPSHYQIQHFLVAQKFPASSADDFLAPSPYSAPQLWRKSETVVAGIEMVDGIGVGEGVAEKWWE